jgi:hypothetical protein
MSEFATAETSINITAHITINDGYAGRRIGRSPDPCVGSTGGGLGVTVTAQ